MIEKKKSVNCPEAGVTVQLHLLGIIVFSLSLVLASAVVTFGLTKWHAAAGQTRTGMDPDGVVDVETANPPPWGQLALRDLDLEQPDEYVAFETGTNHAETWTFSGLVPDQVRALMQSCAMPEPDIDRALSPAMMTVNAGGTVIRPDAALVFGLAPAVRSKLYLDLARFEANQFMRFPFCFPGNTFAKWFGNGRVSPAVLARLQKTVYPRGDGTCFSDLEMLLQQLPSAADRLQLVKALSHQSAVLMGIRVWPDTDIDKLIGYWTWPAGVRLIDCRPLLESLKRRPNGGAVSIIFFLPPFARQRLYTYPLPSEAGDAVMDCHWSTMNYFNETPDNRFSDPKYTTQYLLSHFYKIAQPTAYGDRIFLLDRNGNAIHSAVYLADDIVFTKNGNNFAQPWMLMHLKDLIAEYTTDVEPGMAVYRDKGN